MRLPARTIRLFAAAMTALVLGWYGLSSDPAAQSPVQRNKHIQAVAGLKETATEESLDEITAEANDQDSEGFVTVSKVVDGDTIEIETGQKVRYIGVDTPETVHPKKPVQCFGKEASEHNKNLVEGKKVRLVKDISETDKYGRLLRYVYLEDGTFVNLELVKNGYAYATTFPPDVKYSTVFVEAARQARVNSLGLWGTCR